MAGFALSAGVTGVTGVAVGAATEPSIVLFSFSPSVIIIAVSWSSQWGRFHRPIVRCRRSHWPIRPKLNRIAGARVQPLLQFSGHFSCLPVFVLQGGEAGCPCCRISRGIDGWILFSACVHVESCVFCGHDAMVVVVVVEVGGWLLVCAS